MNYFSTGLRALKHPFTLTAIVILLVNDHILKTAAPSFLTGKLSDFAGLFFFPILLATLLGLLFDRCKIPSHITTSLAFAITLAWFASIKTLPFTNHLTASAFNWLLGMPVQIVMDPSDLSALVMLWPAWRLWKKVESTPISSSPNKFGYLALSLATLATIATAPCQPEYKVARLAVIGQDIVAFNGRPSLDLSSTYDPSYARSTDGGLTWKPLVKPDQGIIDTFKNPPNYPYTTCDPQKANNCYRANTLPGVEASHDGGKTWQAAWRIPWGRVSFINRQRRGVIIASCRGEMDAGPYDLAFVPGNHGSTLVVAIGNEGALLRLPDGSWQRVAVLNAQPSAFVYQQLYLPLIMFENVLAIFLTILGLLILSFWSWRRLAANIPGDRREWAIRPAKFLYLILVAILVFGFFILTISGSASMVWLMNASLISIPIIYITSLSIAWGRHIKLLPGQSVGKILAICLLTTCLFGAGLWIPFPLWELGIIPPYTLAVVLALAFGTLIILLGVMLINRLVRSIFYVET
jgi:hypothetical protein